MAKVKITKKELPYLKGDLNWSPAVLKKVQALQAEHQSKFDLTVEATKAEALARYTTRLEALNQAKSAMTKEYNAEIKKIKTAITNLQGYGKPGRPVKGKTPVKTTPKRTVRRKK